MSSGALRCTVEIDILAVKSPGTWLASGNDVYLSVCLFGQIIRTDTSSSVFPLFFYDKLKFEKIFYSAYEPSLVSRDLKDLSVHIDLMQISDDGCDAQLLAWHNSSAHDFLYPLPSRVSLNGLRHRELLLTRSVLFPGVSPKLEFSTKTVIQETSNLVQDPYQECLVSSRRRGRSRQRSPSVVRSRHRSGYYRDGISLPVVHRHRSSSPDLPVCFEAMSLENGAQFPATEKPPFVVRKVPSDLIGRQPSGDHLVSPVQESKHKKSFSAVRCSHALDSSLSCPWCREEVCVICRAFKHYLGKPYHHRHTCIYVNGTREDAALHEQTQRKTSPNVNERASRRGKGSSDTHLVRTVIRR